jgi:hypothetical protein
MFRESGDGGHEIAALAEQIGQFLRLGREVGEGLLDA